MKAARILKWTLVGLVVLQCGNPVDKDVKWRTSVDLPVTSNKQFFIGALMDSAFFDHKQVKVDKVPDTVRRAGKPDSIYTRLDTMAIVNAYPAVDSTGKKIPDTVAFAFPRHTTAEDTITEDSLKDKRFEAPFGPLPLSGALTNAIAIPIPATPYVGGTPIALPATQVPVKDVRHIRLMDTAQSLQLSVTNGTSATLSSIQITLGTLGTWAVSNLAPGASGSASVNVAGKTIDSTISVALSVTPQGSGTFTAGGSLSISYNLDNLLADSVTVKDSLLAGYQKLFSNPYKLTDTLDVSYIDIADGHFNYLVTNYTSADIFVSVTHRHLWTTAFCASRGITDESGLTGLSKADSSSWDGGVSGPIEFKAGAMNDLSHHQNLSADRLFAEWYPDSNFSVTWVDYLASFGTPRGNYISISANDSLLFVIQAPDFKFKQMLGTSRKILNHTSDTTKPWNSDIKNSLRNKVKFQKIFANVKTRMDIPQAAFIDTVRVHYEISGIRDTNGLNDTVTSSKDETYLNVVRDSVYQRQVDVTDVVNDFPDKVRVKVILTVPLYTRMLAVNDLLDATDPDYRKFTGRMIVPALLDYNVVAPLCWEIDSTVALDLGGDTLDLGKVSGITDPAKKMTDRTAGFTAQITNYSNVYLRLFAIVATDSTTIGPLVDSTNPGYIKSDSLSRYIDNPPQGFVSLLGAGILIPPRDSMQRVQSTVALNEPQLNQILSSKKSGWRWQLRFLPQNQAGAIVPDALSNTDWFKMNSWIHIDGINSIDSLTNGN